MGQKPRDLIIKPLDFEVNLDVITEGFTQSEMQTWDNCPEMWYLRYMLMLEKKNSNNWATIYGSWIHSSLEEYYASGGRRWSWNPEVTHPPKIRNQQWEVDYEYYSKIGETQMKIYTSHYRHDKKLLKPLKGGTEFIADIEFEGFRLKGMMDVVAEHTGKGINIHMDHKTSSRLDRSIVMGWDIRFQFMFYIWLLSKAKPEWKVKGFMPNGFKKPQLKRGPNETMKEFCKRLDKHMREEPEKYFYRELMLLKKGQLDHFETTILRPKLFRLGLLLNPKTPKEVKIAIARNKNTDMCVKYGAKYACQFLDLCHRGFAASKEFYQKRNVKHVELEAEEAE